MDAPKHKYHMTISLGADSVQDLISAFDNIGFQLASSADDGGLDNGWHVVSGGYSNGFILDLTVNHEMTHDEYQNQLRAYIAAKKQGGQ